MATQKDRSRMRLLVPGFLAALLLPASIAAQEAGASPAGSDVPTEAPIVVTGEKEKTKDVYVGSRIPRRAVFTTDAIASNTGTRGLVPQSGMDPAASVRIIRKAGCVSDDPAIGEKAACILADAKTAQARDDLDLARDLLAFLALTEDFTPAERLAGAQWQYRLAQEQGNDASRIAALGQMIETGGLDFERELDARRAQISIALKLGEPEFARGKLVELDTLGGADARRLANLAILTRDRDAGEANNIMRRAIAARQQEEQPVPRGWLDFVKTE